MGSSNDWQLSQDDLWFNINNNGVLRYDGEKLDYLAFPIPKDDTQFYEEETHMPYIVLSIFKDNEGAIWFGTFSRGVIGYDGTSFTYFNPDNFGIGTIRSIYQDRSGNHWFGSNGGGVYYYDGEKHTNLTAAYNLVNTDPMHDAAGTLSRVWAIAQDTDGLMWFGTADSGVWSYDGKQLKNYTMKHGLANNFVLNIYKDRRGVLWFVTEDGSMHHFNGVSFEKI